MARRAVVIASNGPAGARQLALSRSHAQSKILVLDCCNAGQIVYRTGMKGQADRVAMSDLGFKTDAYDVLMASDMLEAAREFDDIEGSFFTQAFLNALGPLFFSADQDGDRAISVTDMQRSLELQADAHNRSTPPPR